MTFLAANMALAGGDADLPAPDPPGYWRYVTQDTNTTSSQCIGDPKTPLCAVETVLACFVRWQSEVCKIINGMIDTNHTAVPGDFERYRVVLSRRLREENIPTHKKTDGKWSWKAGDVQIEIHWRDCSDGDCGQTLWSWQTTYTLRKNENIWSVVTWDTPRVD